MPKGTKARSLALTAGAVLALGAVSAVGHAQRTTPFAGLAGAWNGAGRINMQNGNTERIRCRARYKVAEGGDMLIQDLRCASDSYRIDVNSILRTDGGAVSGTWTETTRNVTGTVTGRAHGGSIQARVFGVGFTAGVSVNTSGGTQSVTITPEGSDIRSVAVTLRKG